MSPQFTSPLTPDVFSPFCSRSERTLYLHSAESLSSGAIASAPTDVSPSTLIPFYDPDTSVVILTGKVNNKQINRAFLLYRENRTHIDLMLC